MCSVPLKCDPSGGEKVTTKEVGLGGGHIRSSMFNLCGDSFSGKFREKASILHKIAKKKCQVEDSEKANGVASRSGKKLFCDPSMQWAI